MMKIITIAGPDKIAIATFISFLKSSVGKDYVVGDMHSLMTSKSIQMYINDFLNKYTKAIFSYYAKRKIKVDPITCIPDSIIKVSDVIVWFNLYSTEYIILKDEVGFDKLYTERWKKNVELSRKG